MFEDKYKSVNDSLHPSAEAEERTLAAMRECADSANEVTRSTDSGRRNTGWRMSKSLVACVAAVLCVLFVAPAVIGITKLADKNNGGQEFSGYVDDGRTVLALNLPEDAAVNTTDDYGAVFAKMRGSLVAYSDSGYHGGYWSPLVDFLDSADLVLERNESDAEAPTAVDESTKAPSYNEPGAQYETDHSETNTQVVGVDEADVVKTDGRYIYVLNGSGVTVLTAAGENSEKIACISAEDMPKHNENSRSSFAEMYLYDGKLVIIADEYVFSEVLYDLPEGYDGDSDDCFFYGYGFGGWRSLLTSVYVYDVSVPEEPKLVSALCQDGAYNTSRVTGGRLYVVTDYAPGGFIFEDLPCTYVPCTYDSNGVCKLTPAADIMIMGVWDFERISRQT